ncbi:MAG TPA: VOC family protein [Steroidobacteraceae bacterium]
MHQSRLSGFIIDCNTEDLEGAASFWGAALGLRVEASAEAGEALYRKLEGLQLDIEVQKVTHPSRVHLDIESTDVEAEVRRLEKLGARRVSALRDWQVMEAPTGQRFCVVPARQGISAGNSWND